MRNLSLLKITFFERNLKAYLFSSSAAKVIPFVGTIVLTHILTPQEYASTSIFVSSIFIFSAISGMGLCQMVVREHHYLDKQELSSLIASGMMLTTLLSIAFALIFTIAFHYNLVPFEEVPYFWIILSILIAPIKHLIDTAAKALVTSNRHKLYTINEITYISLVTSIPIVLLLISPSLNNITTRNIGTIIGLGLSALISTLILKSYLPIFSINAKNIITVFRYGARVLLQTISNLIRIGADKLILAPFIDQNELGSYVFCLVICFGFGFFGTALNNSFIHKCMTYYKNNEIKKIKLVRKKTIISALLVYTLCGACLFFASLVYWPPNYKVTTTSIILCFLAMFFHLAYLIFAKFFIFKDLMHKLGLINLTSTALYVLLIATHKQDLSMDKAFLFLLIYYFSSFLMTYTVTNIYENKLCSDINTNSK